MAKLKGFLLLLLLLLAVDFALENSQPVPMLRLVKLEFFTPPTFLVVYASLFLGFLAGWIGHMRRIKKLRRPPSDPDKAQTQPAE